MSLISEMHCGEVERSPGAFFASREKECSFSMKLTPMRGAVPWASL